MSIETSLRAYLAARPGIAGLVATRVTCGNRPQGAVLPALTIHRVSGGHAHNLDGAAGSARPRIQIDCWSTSYEAVKALAEEVRLALQGYRGVMGDHTVSSVVIDNEIDLEEPPDAGSDVTTYHVAMDFFIRYAETVPTF